MLPLTKTVEESDYNFLVEEVKLLEQTRDKLTANGAKLDDWYVSHTHRKWEWGMAIKALTQWLKNKAAEVGIINYLDVIDVGSGDGLLVPAIHFSDKCSLFNLVEVEPRLECKVNRDKINEILSSNIVVRSESLEDFFLIEEKFVDVIFCISVIEHVEHDKQFLDEIIKLLKPGGLLFLTTDVVPDKSKAYTFDNLRAHNYDVGDIDKMMHSLMVSGFTPFGEVDLEFKSVQVHNYSFCSLSMIKQ